MIHLPIYDNDLPPVDLELPTIDASFLAQSDVVVISPSTVGSDGTTGTWPTSFIYPQTTSKKYFLILPGDYTSRKSPNYTTGRLMPFQGGTEASPVFYIGVKNTTNQLTIKNLHPAFKTDAEQTKLPGLMLVGSGAPYSVSWCRFVGIEFPAGMGQVTASSNHNIIKWCSTASISQAIRIRSGSSYNNVSECLFLRTLPFPTTTDVVCIQFSDGPEWIDNVIEYNTIIGYTDQVQTTDRSNYGSNGSSDYGFAAGLRVNNNYMGLFSEYHENEDSTSTPGIEQSGWDLKTGGTSGNRCRFLRNVVFGNRPNSGTPGYAVTIHRVFDYADFDENLFTDNESALSLNIQYVHAITAEGAAANHLRMRRNIFVDCHDNGSSFFPGKRGKVYVGLATFEEFSGNKIYRCDELSEAAPHASWQAVQPMSMEDNIWYSPSSFGTGLFANQAAWEVGNAVDTATDKTISLGIPFTERSIQVHFPESDTYLQVADETAAVAARSAINANIESLLTLNGFTLTDGDTNVFTKKAGVTTADKIAVPTVRAYSASGSYYVENPSRIGNNIASVKLGVATQLITGVTITGSAKTISGPVVIP